jgi:hypothetical protein
MEMDWESPYNTNTIPVSNALPANTPSAITRTPKLTEIERQLLFNNEGCLKCHRVFITYRSANCPNGFPSATVYKPLSQADVDRIKHTRASKPITSVTSTASTFTSNDQNIHPVAVVMGSSSNPVTYIPINKSNVIGSANNSIDSNESVSTVASTIVGSVMATALQPSTMLDHCNAPLCLPHFMWECSANGADNCFLVKFNALIDNGCHTVLIRDDLANKLALHHRKLPQLELIEMAMEGDGKKVIVTLHEWVKLKVYDPSSW